MADRRPTEGIDVSAFFGVLRRRALIIVAVVLAAAAGAYIVSKGQKAKYTATTKLLLKGTSSNTANSGGQPTFGPTIPSTSPDREALVTRGAVLKETQRRLAQRIGDKRAGEVVSKLTAFSGQDSQVVELRAEASDPSVAADAANTLGAVNIDLRKAQTIAELRRAERSAEQQIAKLSPTNQNDAPALGALRTQLTNLKGTEATTDGNAEVVQQASAPSSPSSPKPTQNAIIGAFGGLLLGLAIALVREQLDRRVRHSKQLEEAFGLPVLASVPKSRAFGGQNGRALERLPAREAEAFQILRANLHYLNKDTELRSVVVTSAGVGDGKSTVSLNLAKADAIVGKKVLLVEADVRRPQLAGLLGLDSDQGLTTFLSERDKPLADVTHRVPVGPSRDGQASPTTLDVVVAGPVPDNPSGLIDSDRMRSLIRQAERSYDFVVLDTPPASMVADPISLMSQATAVVIVGRVGKITSAEADGLREQLERIDAPGFGLVANFAPKGAKEGYGYY